MALELCEHPSRVSNPAFGTDPAASEFLPLFPDLTSVKLDGYTIAYGHKRPGFPLNFLTAKLESSQYGEIVRWYEQQTGGAVSRWSTPELVDHPSLSSSHAPVVDAPRAETATEESEYEHE